ncbi:siderophore ferric iron reductase [Endozoicomonas ascidiicola]|uniref:siderophore ferric iron reductase n=1 Tax=Endozoicomonas ascidiicola TaxID=1698521 RepID=UPI000830BA9E|nr:siderophore ferric iron reductase [Endozoicomonas ascidiicola]
MSSEQFSSDQLQETSEGACRTSEVYSRLFAAGSALSPLLYGSKGNPADEQISYTTKDVQTVKGLYDRLKNSFPEAGRGYWAVRSWDLLIWQPVMLSIIAVYSMEAIPPLRLLGQSSHNGMVAGYTLPEGTCFTGETELLIQKAGHELADLSALLLSQLQQVCSFKPVLAQRLLSDQLLASLIRIPFLYGKGITLPILESHAPLWLQSTGLTSRPLQLTDSFELKRTGCCLHYLRQDADVCSNYPKKARLQKLQQKKAEHVCTE